MAGVVGGGRGSRDRGVGVGWVVAVVVVVVWWWWWFRGKGVGGWREQKRETQF